MKIIEVIKYNQHKDTVDEFNRLDTAGERIREFKSNRKSRDWSMESQKEAQRE